MDENGLVTGVGGGRTTVYAYTADGSKKRAATTVEVIVPVTGVTYKHKDLRVGANGYGTFTATIQPSNASNKAMTWVSSDDSIATVTGTTNRFKVSGRRWGRCKVTGTTEDGSFTVSVNVDVGSLRHAVVATTVQIKNGKPYLALRNQSDMNLSQVRYLMLGYDQSLQPIAMSTVGDVYTLEGSYNVGLPAGERTSHGQFTFYRPSNYDGLAVLQFCITGWSTDTGYYDQNGMLQYNYNIAEDKWEWITLSLRRKPAGSISREGCLRRPRNGGRLFCLSGELPLFDGPLVVYIFFSFAMGTYRSPLPADGYLILSVFVAINTLPCYLTKAFRYAMLIPWHPSRACDILI